MRLRAAALTVILAILAVPVSPDAQQPAKVLRIGFLAAGSAAPYGSLIEAFRQGLREAGYVEDQSIVIEYRWAEGEYDRLPALAADLVRLKVDVIVTAIGTPPALAAKNVTRTIPIVFTAVGDPVAQGLIASLARPGGNVTGVASLNPELMGKRLELLKETLPKVSRMGVLWNPGNAVHALFWREAEAAARSLGVHLQSLEARDPADFDRAFAATTRRRAGVLIVLPDAMFVSQRVRLATLALKNRLPTMFATREYVEAGGLMAYGLNNPDVFRRAATYVDRILKGARPDDLPVEQPMRFDLVLNLKTAKALGLTFPQTVLVQVTEVIQ